MNIIVHVYRNIPLSTPCGMGNIFNIFGREQPPEDDVSEEDSSQTEDELDVEPGSLL